MIHYSGIILRFMMLIRYFVVLFLIQLLGSSNLYAQRTLVDSLIQWIKENPKIDSQYIANLHKISYRTSETDIKTSFEYYERVMTLSNELNFPYGKSLAQINLGILLSESANFEASNDAYFKAIKYADEADAPRLKSISLNNIGENFRSLKDLGKCRQYTYDAIDINKGLKAWRGVAINYELLMQCDLEEKRYDEAERNLDTGFRYANLSGENFILSVFNTGFGKLASINGDMELAAVYFDEAMRLASIENDRRNIYNVLMARAEYLQNITLKKKLSFLDSAYSIAMETGYLEGIGNTAQLLSNLYDERQNKDSSMKYFHIYRKTFDTIFSENNKRNVIIKESDWMIKQKEIENQHLQQISSIQKKDIRFKNILLIAAVALLLLTGGITFFVYKNIRASKRRQAAEFEKEMLHVKMASLHAQMNPHFIFNCLNSIENFVMQNDKLSASQYLNKFASLIRTTLDSSRMDAISFERSFKAILNYVELERLRLNNKFEVITEVDSTLLDPKYQIPPLVIQPYVENAIFHGIAPSETDGLYLKIKANISNGYINYIVEDNGIGRELSHEYRKNNPGYHKSVGMKLTKEKMNIYSRQHKTATDIKIIDLWENGKAAGTRVVLRIKIN